MTFIALLFSLLFACTTVQAAPSALTVWANNGEDKVTQHELRATQGQSVLNSVWDGKQISVFGARNEVVAFNVILEASVRDVRQVSASFHQLTGPSGAVISSTKAEGDGVFDWTQRAIEIFYVRYLQIRGLSLVANETYDERLIPHRLRRPWKGDGVGKGEWLDRPDCDTFYPDIAVPLEVVRHFSITKGTNQSLWTDVYIPKNAPSGVYRGEMVIREKGRPVHRLPVALTVYAFTLPDEPSAKTMLAYSRRDIHRRYMGLNPVSADSETGAHARLLRDRHYLMAHRHRISLIGDDPRDCDSKQDVPCPESLPRLDGSLFTAANGYAGPGVGTGNNVYSIGTYGSWAWRKGTESDMHQRLNAWGRWFQEFSPATEVFLYLIDESKDYPLIEKWAGWIASNPGPGQHVKSLATLPLPQAAENCPSLDIPASTVGPAIPSQWQPLLQHYTHDSRKRFFMYNGHRPGSGSFVIEDDGVALRQVAWGQYKKGIDRWFYWMSTYYSNDQAKAGETNVFQKAHTFGYSTKVEKVLGETGWNYGNGDGVLFYPGTDRLFPAESYGLNGPLASLRLKYWRRGIQDVDYLTQAAAIDPQAVESIVNRIVPKVLWEYGVSNPLDPSYIRTEISWSTDPDVWEKAREQLARIITGQKSGQP